MKAFNYPIEITSSEFYVLSQNLQHLWFYIVVANGKEAPARIFITTSRSYMKVIAAVSGLLSTSCDECTEVCLVWKTIL